MIHWPSFLRRIRLRFPLPIRMVYLRGCVQWSMLVADHTTNETRWQDSPPVPVPATDDEHVALRWVRYWTQVMVLHELDETLYLDERRPFNPHLVFPLPRVDT